MWERYYRSPRHRDMIPGSGLGLWIARSLVMASNGRVESFSAGIGHGATMSIYLPAQHRAGPEFVETSDD
jgi:signal transduction histidine kinase